MTTKAEQSPYYGKMISAPMVRVSSLAFRMMCAKNGADLVFTEEMVVIKLAKCAREVVEYPAFPGKKVAEYVVYEDYKRLKKRAVVFSTFARDWSTEAESYPEGAPVIAQLGAACPELAAKAAALICEDVDGFDVNMGCPKKFSVDNGMGAALMKDPERAAAILVAMDKAVNSDEQIAARPNKRRIPISFKTRVFDDMDASIAQLSKIFDTGVPHALSLHARTKEQRSETPARYEFAAELIKKMREKYGKDRCPCLVLNGSVEGRVDGLQKMQQYGFDGCLLGRSCMWDPTVFNDAERKANNVTDLVAATSIADGGQRAFDVFLELLHLARDTFMPYQYVKYHITRSFQEFPFAKTSKIHPKLQAARGYVDTAIVFGMSEEDARKAFGSLDEEMEIRSFGMPLEEALAGMKAAAALEKKQNDVEDDDKLEAKRSKKENGDEKAPCC